jgi:hypothetical protein
MSRQPRIPGTRKGSVLYVLPQIPDDLEPTVKNALAIRNACATNGVCSGCGAVGELHPDRRIAKVWRYVFRHEPWCPALTDEAAA